MGRSSFPKLDRLPGYMRSIDVFDGWPGVTHGKESSRMERSEENVV